MDSETPRFNGLEVLADGDDDHPEAAWKHLDDAVVLLAGGRLDGVAYHAGYVVECSLKAVLLHDKSFDSSTGKTNAKDLAKWAKALRFQPFGHNLAALLSHSLGPAGAPYCRSFRPRPRSCSSGARPGAITRRERWTRRALKRFSRPPWWRRTR